MDNQNYLIGFANNYYTLWLKSTPKPIFIKNISQNLDEVKRQYPDIEIDSTLKGFQYKSFQREKIPFQLFQFGKYYKQPIIDTKDYDYLIWYYKCIVDSSEPNIIEIKQDHLNIIKHTLQEAKYKLIENVWLTQEKYLEYCKEQEIYQKCKELYKSGKQFTIEIKCNPDSNGYIEIPYGFYLVFPEVKEYYYNGFEYYLPILNGKSKRIKNKIITVEKYRFDNSCNTIYVEHFTVHK